MTKFKLYLTISIICALLYLSTTLLSSNSAGAILLQDNTLNTTVTTTPTGFYEGFETYPNTFMLKQTWMTHSFSNHSVFAMLDSLTFYGGYTGHLSNTSLWFFDNMSTDYGGAWYYFGMKGYENFTEANPLMNFTFYCMALQTNAVLMINTYPDSIYLKMGQGDNHWWFSTNYGGAHHMNNSNIHYTRWVWYKVEILIDLETEDWSFTINDIYNQSSHGFWNYPSPANKLIYRIGFTTHYSEGAEGCSYWLDDIYVNALSTEEEPEEELPLLSSHWIMLAGILTLSALVAIVFLMKNQRRK